MNLWFVVLTVATLVYWYVAANLPDINSGRANSHSSTAQILMAVPTIGSILLWIAAVRSYRRGRLRAAMAFWLWPIALMIAGLFYLAFVASS